MYERAQYYRSKYIRNGIAGLVISALLIYYTATKNEPFTPAIIIFPIVAFMWFYFGLWINKKLKVKIAATESQIIDERFPFKQIEYFLSLLIAIALVLGFQHWKFADYLIIPLVIAYVWWSYYQMKLLNNYFKT
jgi:hypothetical protein